MENNNSITLFIYLIFLFSLLQRWSVSLNPYSGAGSPPMFGDYEAQRHWMEITHHLPVDKWYVQGADNDLQYWGLDYPPLTAYHSKLCGYFSNLLNSDWVALNTSRGYESYEHKLFMRYSVVAVDVFIYMTSITLVVTSLLAKANDFEKAMGVLLLLSYPGLILIDHGHFQYNCVSLGFTAFSIYFILKSYHSVASLFFVLALNYKQMSLYHSFPFFFYLLGVSYHQNTWFKSLWKLMGIGMTVVATFLLCWLPFLLNIEDSLYVLERLFPFNRGLFEDKVANVWCALSVVIKLKNILQQPQIIKLCLGSTLLACLPSCIDVLRYPTKKKFLYSLINCSLAFFLFSYQVHEKSILIVVLPVLLVVFDEPLITIWFSVISTFSMYPLLERDGQSMSYIALTLIYLVIAYFYNLKLSSYHTVVKLMFGLSLIGACFIHIGFATIKPPLKLPDLFPLLFATYSCLHFVLFWLYFNYRQWKCESQDVQAEMLSEKTKLKTN